MRARGVLLAGAAWLALAPGVASGVWVQDNVAPFQAQAALNFSLTVGKFLYLQVGSPGAVVDTVRFDLAAALPATGVATAAAPFGLGSGSAIGAVSSGTLQVIVRGNSGAISLSATNNGGGLGMSNGSGAYLSYAEILASSDNAGLNPPVLTNAGSTTVSVVANAHGGRVTNQVANWTFRLANRLVPAPGSYTGQVVYTAAMP
jgi:hypothetical protein